MFVVGVALAALTAADRMPPALLLTLTFALGGGQALTMPAWQAADPGAGAARPAAGGLRARRDQHERGPRGRPGDRRRAHRAASAWPRCSPSTPCRSWCSPSCCCAGAGRPATARARPSGSRPALRAGGRYVRHSLIVRRILLRAGAVRAARQRAVGAAAAGRAASGWGWAPAGTGCCSAALGVGAVAGALRPAAGARRGCRPTGCCSLAGVVFAAAHAGGRAGPPAGRGRPSRCCRPAWPGWRCCPASTPTMQLFLPDWVRARGLASTRSCSPAAQAWARCSGVRSPTPRPGDRASWPRRAGAGSARPRVRLVAAARHRRRWTASPARTGRSRT